MLTIMEISSAAAVEGSQATALVQTETTMAQAKSTLLLTMLPWYSAQACLYRVGRMHPRTTVLRGGKQALIVKHKQREGRAQANMWLGL